MKESTIQLLQVSDANIPTPMCARLLLSFLLRQTQLRLYQLNTKLVGAVVVVREPPLDGDG
jgi:hypothetical protein